MLPYTSEVYFRLIAQYYASFPGLPVIAWLLALMVVVALIRPFPGRDRLIAGVVAAGWLWTGIVFHYGWFATINFAAPVYAALFLVQGAVMLWVGVVRHRVTYARPGGGRGMVGLAVAGLGGLVWPLLDLAFGHGWGEVRIAGATPAPTALLLLGLSLLTRGCWPWQLLIVPLIWVVAGTLTGWILGVPQDMLLALAAAVVLVTALTTRPGRRA